MGPIQPTPMLRAGLTTKQGVEAQEAEQRRRQLAAAAAELRKKKEAEKAKPVGVFQTLSDIAEAVKRMRGQ